MSITQPNLENVWAEEGSPVAPTLDQLLSGWEQNQFPPSEVANYLQNKVELAVKYLYQVGFAGWQEYLEYQPSNIVAHNGRHWIATNPSKNKKPEVGSGFWKFAFDPYGASDDLRVEVSKIIAEDGYLPHYVRKADPVMNAKAKAPSFEADVGAGQGYQFKNYQSGMSCAGGDLIFMVDGKASGRIKKDAKLESESDPNVLVNVGMIAELIASITKAMQLPIGYSIITNHRKPPSDPAQLGYGVWELDVQGRALVGVSLDTAVTTPEWVKDPNSKVGEYEHTMTEEELVPHKHGIGGRWQDGGSGGVQGGNKSENYVTSTNDAGGGKPFNIVQPSQTKFIWTRVS